MNQSGHVGDGLLFRCHVAEGDAEAVNRAVMGFFAAHSHRFTQNPLVSVPEGAGEATIMLVMKPLDTGEREKLQEEFKGVLRKHGFACI